MEASRAISGLGGGLPRGRRSVTAQPARTRRVRASRGFRTPAGRLRRASLASLVAVLFAITVLTFLIFQAIPDGDPALRMAGRLASPQQVQARARAVGLRQADLRAVPKTMEKVLDGSVISYSQQINVEQEIVRDLPPTISLALGAGSSGWCSACCSACSARSTPDASSTAC